MHNCKATRKTLNELALDELDENQSLLVELEACGACRQEYARLKSMLRVASQAVQSAMPAESFWADHHQRLQQHIESAARSAVPASSYEPRTSLLTMLRNLATASVRVPVPIAAILIVFFGLSFIFAMNLRPRINVEPTTGAPSVVTKIVEVPTIHDRLVTRVVYRERNRTTATQPMEAARNSSNTAHGEDKTNGQAPVSLVGFKPANDIKLTIIKGSYRDEK